MHSGEKINIVLKKIGREKRGGEGRGGREERGGEEDMSSTAHFSGLHEEGQDVPCLIGVVPTSLREQHQIQFSNQLAQKKKASKPKLCLLHFNYGGILFNS